MLSLEAESWTWYGITWFILIVRLISRRLLLGSWRKFQADDYLMLVAMATFTVLIVAMNIVATTSSNLIDPNDTRPLDDDMIKERRYGSKMVLVVEQMQCATIWLVKGCLLIMYHRLTMSLRQNLAVKIVTGYVVFGYILMEILYLAVWCRPFNQYWAVPPDSTQCSAATNHLITNMVLNISSDLMIIAIPMPIFLSSSLSVQRKAVLCGVFAVGLFTIISAILNKYYSFTQPFGSDWTIWYIRESATAILTANLPLTWTLLQRVFNLQSFREKYYSNHGSRSGGTASRFRSTGYHNRRRSRNPRSTIRDAMASVLDRNGSEDHINTELPLKIYQKREVEISTIAAEPGDTRRMRMSSSDSLPDGMKTVTMVKGSHLSKTLSNMQLSDKLSDNGRQHDESASEKSVGTMV